MSIPSLLSFKAFQEKHSNAFTVGGLRHQIFNEEKNGLKESGAIIRLGKKILVDEVKYFLRVFRLHYIVAWIPRKFYQGRRSWLMLKSYHSSGLIIAIKRDVVNKALFLRWK
jgi:hypothetical protein